MDYLSYYNLRSEPFSNVPLSEFYFGSKQHTDALNRLLHVARNMKGLAVLVGDVGRGKSTLARRLLEALPEEDFEAAMLVVVHNAAGPKWLLHRLAMQLGVEEPADDPLALVSQLYHRLVAIHQGGKRTVVLVDEAQMLTTREMMEEFRGLLNLEVPGHKLITFVFFGLPDLEQNLKLDPPLAQRVALRYQLSALSPDETAAYVNHRLQIAGATQTLFDSDALWDVHRYSGGVPRVINTLCDNVLLEMFFGRMLKADAARVVEVATNLKLTLDNALPAKPATALPVMAPPASLPAISALDLEELIPEPLDADDAGGGDGENGENDAMLVEAPVQRAPVVPLAPLAPGLEAFDEQRASALKAFDKKEAAEAVEDPRMAAPAPRASSPALMRAPLFPPAPRAPAKATAVFAPSSRMLHEFEPPEEVVPIPRSEAPAAPTPPPSPVRPKETVLDLDAMSFAAPAEAPAADPADMDIDIEVDEGQSFSGRVPAPRDINDDADSIAAIVASDVASDILRSADETVDLPGDTWQGVQAAGDFLGNTAKMQPPKLEPASARPQAKPEPKPEARPATLAARARTAPAASTPAAASSSPAPGRAAAPRPVLDTRSKNLLADVDSLLADLDPKRK